MTHNDWKSVKLEDSDYKCMDCGSDDIWYRVVTSSDEAHDDINYECKSCNKNWWYEGSDA